MSNTLKQPVIKFLSILLVMLIGISLSHAARPGKPGMRVYDQGLKEDTRVYRVICENGTRTRVSVRFETPQPILDLEGNPVTSEDQPSKRSYTSSRASKDFRPLEICAHPNGKKDYCKARWDIDKAASYACKQSK